MNTILDQLKKDYKLNENDSFIAEYILKHSEEIPLLSSHQLAKKTFTSPTAIIRFIKKIGFDNYNDFKLNIHSFLNKYYLSDMNIKSHENLYSIKNKLAEIECGIIHQTKENIDSNVFDQIISLISKNKYIDIIANDTNSTIGEYASHLLSSVNKIVNVYHNQDKQLWFSFNVDNDHTVVIVSKHGKNKRLLQIADVLRERKIPFIIITSKHAKELASKTPYVLYGILHEQFENLRDSIFYISLKYIFDLIYTILISNDLKQAKKLDQLYTYIYNQEN